MQRRFTPGLCTLSVRPVHSVYCLNSVHYLSALPTLSSVLLAQSPQCTALPSHHPPSACVYFLKRSETTAFILPSSPYLIYLTSIASFTDRIVYGRAILPRFFLGCITAAVHFRHDMWEAELLTTKVTNLLEMTMVRVTDQSFTTFT